MSRIKPKIDSCVICGLDRAIFARRMCQRCYRNAVSKKAMDKLNLMAKNKLRKYRLPTRRALSVSAMTGGVVSQPTLFKKLWDDNCKDGRWTCYFTGEDITMYAPPHPLWMNCCMHVLNKGKYPHWKFHIQNMRLGHPEFHALVDQGSSDQRRRSRFPAYSFELFNSLKEELKGEYERFKRDNCLP